MNKQEQAVAIWKLYELRREEKMRKGGQWVFSDFAPQTATDIVKLYRAGERANANFRNVTSYWNMASSFVLNGALDEKYFLDANTEHIFFLRENRFLFRRDERTFQ